MLQSCLGRVKLVRWLKRLWRCRKPACSTGCSAKPNGSAPPRAVLTRRRRVATDALAHDMSVSVLARQLGVDWHTAWNAIGLEARARTSDPQRLAGVKASE